MRRKWWKSRLRRKKARSAKAPSQQPTPKQSRNAKRKKAKRSSENRTVIPSESRGTPWRNVLPDNTRSLDFARDDCCANQRKAIIRQLSFPSAEISSTATLAG